MAKLAIDGGKKIFEVPAAIPAWPPVYPETAEKLKEIYLSHSWSFYGPQEVLFNEKFAQYTGAGHSIMMANGTVTLEMAMKAMGIGTGDEVIVPAHTWLATGKAVVYRGATPVVVDIEPDTLCMDPAEFEAAITPKTKAVIPVHLFGSIADMDRIMEIAKKHKLKVIEDCAHAHGGVWNGKHVGTIGDVGSFSFQQSKIMASGEGGVCLTNDDSLADILGRLSHIGYQRGAKQGQKGTPPPMGLICHNYRVTDFQAAILLSQLEHLKEDTLLRDQNAEYLRKRLNAIPGIRVQARGKHATVQSYYAFVVMVDHTHLKEGITRKEVLAALQAEGIGISEGWGQPMYRQNLWTVPENQYRIESNEVAETIVMKQIMMSSLTWLMISRSDLDKYCDAFEKVMEEYYRSEQ
ncbi:MAG: L-glutamine:2-deoxy-scyllo-inosose aminotransferase [Lentisphaerae bacterium ADurb.Bin242]|nr:MAG: L-glutamine:2-deoxy-scyllo-inosose aminotransferase [Lentisphaerae bacterium ADurb.Bin242]